MRSSPILLVLPLTACFAEGYSMKDRVTEAARRYNEGVQWNKVDQSAGYLPREERKAFVERMAALEDELEISNAEMVQLDVDKKHDKATARMTYEWSLKRHGLVEKTATEQTWKEKDGKWVMVREVRLRGSPLPLFKERSELGPDGDEGDSAGTAHRESEKEPEREPQGALAGGPGPTWKK
jgi:hypothetical protein